jgi:hypothetical protein
MSLPRKAASLATLVVLCAQAGPSAAQMCSPASGGPSAAEWLNRAVTAVGADRLNGAILKFEATASDNWNYQSDRPWYPPYLVQYTRRQFWYDPGTGVEAFAASPLAANGPRTVVLGGPGATFFRRDTLAAPAQAQHAGTRKARPLNPWSVLHDWRAAGDSRVVARCLYREYPRIALARGDAGIEERLLIDPKTAFPVRYSRIEPHYLWGQVRVEYVYTTWQQAGSGYYPLQSYRLVDGAEETTRALVLAGGSGPALPVARDSAPDLRLPDPALRMTELTEPFLVPTNPDTIRVASNAFLLKNRGYTEMVTLERDTVFMLEATQGDERARQDSVWIGRLFPGRHPVAVIVTDLAWPHIAGVRFWVAAGATIISHHTSKPMLERVVAKRWTLAPDRLEARRTGNPLRFRPVTDSLRLAGGRVTLYAIDGIGSEGALMAWLPASATLWGSDYLQDPSQPTLYTTEVVRAARRAGIAPRQTAAQHFPLTPWEKVEALAPAQP